jgi:hypothetical protein
MKMSAIKTGIKAHDDTCIAAEMNRQVSVATAGGSARIVGRHRLKWLDRLRWYLDRIQGRPRHQVKADPRPSPGLRLPDDVAERDR